MPLANSARGAYRGTARIRRVYQGSTPLLGRTNVVVNPRFIGLSGWTPSGTPAPTFTNPSDGGILRGRITATTISAVALNGTAAAPVVAGQSVVAQALLRGTPGRQVQIRITWSGATPTISPTFTLLSATAEQLATFAAVAPVGATAARVDFRFPDPALQPGNYLELRSVMLDRNTAVVRAYRDGTFPGWGWDGTADASTSSGWN